MFRWKNLTPSPYTPAMSEVMKRRNERQNRDKTTGPSLPPTPSGDSGAKAIIRRRSAATCDAKSPHSPLSRRKLIMPTKGNISTSHKH